MSRRRLFLTAALALAGGILLLLIGIQYAASSASIEIVNAEYGVPGRTCNAAVAISKHVSDACGGFRPRCLVSVSSGWCGDPAPGVVKTLSIEYRCGETRKRASAAEYTGVVLACP